MPEMSLKESILSSLNAQEPWPDNVKLFQPYEVEQILLPDNASCLAVQAFLKMANLPFEVEMRWNAEFMSPSGRVPFIKCGAFVVSELEPIVQFAANKGVTLCSKLSGEEKAEMRAYMSLITNVLVNAELYISWLDEATFTSVTRVRNSSVYPWPLGWLQTRAKRAQVSKRLRALNWHNKSLEQVLADVEQCCTSLTQRLGDREYFFGTPTPLDALLYGHVKAILDGRGPKDSHLRKRITPQLLCHFLRISDDIGGEITPQESYYMSVARIRKIPKGEGELVMFSDYADSEDMKKFLEDAATHMDKSNMETGDYLDSKYAISGAHSLSKLSDDVLIEKIAPINPALTIDTDVYDEAIDRSHSDGKNLDLSFDEKNEYEIVDQEQDAFMIESLVTLDDVCDLGPVQGSTDLLKDKEVKGAKSKESCGSDDTERVTIL